MSVKGLKPTKVTVVDNDVPPVEMRVEGSRYTLPSGSVVVYMEEDDSIFEKGEEYQIYKRRGDVRFTRKGEDVRYTGISGIKFRHQLFNEKWHVPAVHKIEG